MKWSAVPILGLVIALASGSAAAMDDNMPMDDYAELSCLAHGELTNYLGRAYGEGRVASGELEDGNGIELFVSRNGSWTLIEKHADGTACVQASGQRMQVERTNRPDLADAPS